MFVPEIIKKLNNNKKNLEFPPIYLPRKINFIYGIHMTMSI